MGRFIRPGAWVLEADAGIGVASLYLSSAIGDSGHLLAYEADRLLHHLAHQNLAANRVRNVTLLKRHLGPPRASDFRWRRAGWKYVGNPRFDRQPARREAGLDHDQRWGARRRHTRRSRGYAVAVEAAGIFARRERRRGGLGSPKRFATSDTSPGDSRYRCSIRKTIIDATTTSSRGSGHKASSAFPRKSEWTSSSPGVLRSHRWSNRFPIRPSLPAALWN